VGGIKKVKLRWNNNVCGSYDWYIKRNAMIYNSLPFIDQISTTLKIPLRQPLEKATKNQIKKHMIKTVVVLLPQVL